MMGMHKFVIYRKNKINSSPSKMAEPENGHIKIDCLLKLYTLTNRFRLKFPVT
jgi:hypothetical protein